MNCRNDMHRQLPCKIPHDDGIISDSELFTGGIFIMVRAPDGKISGSKSYQEVLVIPPKNGEWMQIHHPYQYPVNRSRSYLSEFHDSCRSFDGIDKRNCTLSRQVPVHFTWIDDEKRPGLSYFRPVGMSIYKEVERCAG